MQEQIDGRRCAGQVALVTGASRGIGAAIARRLAAEGAAVACAARTLDPDPRYEGSLAETVATINADGGRAEAFQADLSKTDDRHALVAAVGAALGPVDILVNNAAVTFFLPIDTFPEKRFRLMVEMQVWAAIELSQLVIPSMRAAGGGWILNISSRAAVKPVGPPFESFYTDGGSAVYGLCKAALERLSLGMAAELGKDNIAVNTLAPWDNVATPGASAHDLVADYKLEPVEVIAEAALQLCAGDRARLTGRVAYSQPILDELGVTPRALTGGVFVPVGPGAPA
jgi:NAD(P)-dependent dehydrogenase (short-subunit alcohol dehydrogenase family)